MSDFPRRALLKGAAASAIAASKSSEGMTPTVARSSAGTPIASFSSRRDMAAAATEAGALIFLDEAGRAGLFRCVAGSPPGVDPLEGLYVRAAGRNFHYARVWDGTHARPEWFGAQTDDPRFDCADPIEACHALCPVTELAQADYFIRRTLRLSRSWRTMRGIGMLAHDQGQGTRIILHRAAAEVQTGDVLLVGSERQPTADPIAFPQEMHFSDFTLIRDGASTPHGSGELARYPTGLRVSYVIRCTFSGIFSAESSVGFYIGGAIYTKFDDCTAQRALPGTDPRNDYMVGFLLDGHHTFGWAGGNASLYLNRCIVTGQHPRHVDAVGLLARGAFVDTFIDALETAQIATGISFRVEGARHGSQTIDVHIRNAVLDGCSRFGLDLNLDATAAASIEIIDPYITHAGESGDRGLLVHDGAGLVTITGGQVHGNWRGGSLWFSRTRGIRVQGTKIQNGSRPIVVTEATALVLEPQINNVGLSSPQFAIAAEALTRCIVRPVVLGAGGPSFAGGVSLGAGSSHCEIDGSAIDPSCFTVATAANKVWFGGGDAHGGSSGAFAAAGNVLVGVTG